MNFSNIWWGFWYRIKANFFQMDSLVIFFLLFIFCFQFDDISGWVLYIWVLSVETVWRTVDIIVTRKSKEGKSDFLLHFNEKLFDFRYLRNDYLLSNIWLFATKYLIFLKRYVFPRSPQFLTKVEAEIFTFTKVL